MEFVISDIYFSVELTFTQILAQVQIIEIEDFLARLAYLLFNFLGMVTFDFDSEFNHSWIESIGLTILIESHILLENVQGLLVLGLYLADLLLEVQLPGLSLLHFLLFSEFLIWATHTILDCILLNNLLDGFQEVILIFVVRGAGILLTTTLLRCSRRIVIFRRGALSISTSSTLQLFSLFSQLEICGFDLLAQGDLHVGRCWDILHGLAEKVRIIVVQESVSDFHHGTSNIIILIGLWPFEHGRITLQILHIFN